MIQLDPVEAPGSRSSTATPTTPPRSPNGSSARRRRRRSAKRRRSGRPRKRRRRPPAARRSIARNNSGPPSPDPGGDPARHADPRRHPRRRHGRAARRADVGVRDGRIVAIGDVDDDAAARRRRRRSRRRARLRRPAHALRRAAVLGSGREPVEPARRHERHRRQLRLHARAARLAGRRLPAPDDGEGRGHAAAGARDRRAVDVAIVRRVPRRARRQRRPQRRLPRRPLRAPAQRHGRRRDRGRGDARATRGDGAAAARVDRRRRPRVLDHALVHALRRRRQAGRVALGVEGRSARAVRRGAGPRGHDARVRDRRLPARLQRRRGRDDGGDDARRAAAAQLERAHDRLARAGALPRPARGVRARVRAGRQGRRADDAGARRDEHVVPQLLRAVHAARLERGDEPAGAGAHREAARPDGPAVDERARPFARSRRVRAARVVGSLHDRRHLLGRERGPEGQGRRRHRRASATAARSTRCSTS